MKHLQNIYQKSYEDGDDDNARAKIFIYNREKIDRHNARFERGEVTYRMGVNKFTDMVADEIRNYRG